MRGKKSYWYLNALPIIFLPMSILGIMLVVSQIKFAISYGSLPSEFWPSLPKYHLVYWLVLFYPAYYVFCWRRSLRMADEQVQKLITKMTIASGILTLWAAGTTYMIYLELSTAFNGL